MELECAGCRGVMNVRPSRVRINKGRGIFCSKGCRHESSVEKRICYSCGTTFIAYKTNTKKYCCQTCRPAWNKGHTWTEDVRVKLKAAVARRGGMAGPNNPHWDSSVLARKCKTCKCTFRPKAIARAKRGYGIYCSKTCYQKAKGESVPEQLTRKALDQLGEIYQSQMVIGFYTVDFLLPFRTTVIEVDGRWWHDNPTARRRDKAKTTYLTNRHFRVIRVPENAIRQDAVGAIAAALT